MKEMMGGPSIGKWVSLLYRIGQSYFDRCFAECGIGSGHYSFLLCLYRQEGMTQDAISKYVNVDKATTTRAISALEALGYVVRQADPLDKRVCRVFLTDQGRLLEPKVRSVLKDWAGIVTNDLNSEEQKVAYQLLQRMAENALAAKKNSFEVKP
jgi:DNA-binding MarR family transcriptional regulator